MYAGTMQSLSDLWEELRALPEVAEVHCWQELEDFSLHFKIFGGIGWYWLRNFIVERLPAGTPFTLNGYGSREGRDFRSVENMPLQELSQEWEHKLPQKREAITTKRLSELGDHTSLLDSLLEELECLTGVQEASCTRPIENARVLFEITSAEGFGHISPWESSGVWGEIVDLIAMRLPLGLEFFVNGYSKDIKAELESLNEAEDKPLQTEEKISEQDIKKEDSELLISWSIYSRRHETNPYVTCMSLALYMQDRLQVSVIMDVDKIICGVTGVPAWGIACEVGADNPSTCVLKWEFSECSKVWTIEDLDRELRKFLETLSIESKPAQTENKKPSYINPALFVSNIKYPNSIFSGALSLPQGVSIQAYPNGSTTVGISPMNTTASPMNSTIPEPIKELTEYHDPGKPLTLEMLEEARKQIQSYNPYAPHPEVVFPYSVHAVDPGEFEKGIAALNDTEYVNSKISLAQTHSMELELSGGRFISIPPPGEGWVEVYHNDGKWNPAEVGDLYGRFKDSGLEDCGIMINSLHRGSQSLVITHEAGRMALAEYFAQLSAEPARVVSWTGWNRKEER